MNEPNFKNKLITDDTNSARSVRILALTFLLIIGYFGVSRVLSPIGELLSKPTVKPQSQIAVPQSKISKKEIDWGSYIQSVQTQIKKNWQPPEEASSKRTKVIFTVNKSGKIRNLKVIASSGSAACDKAALQAVLTAAPFAPLPAGPNQSVDIEFTFDYNVFKRRH